MPDVPIILFTAYAESLEEGLPVDLVVSKMDVKLMSHIRSLVPLEKPLI